MQPGAGAAHVVPAASHLINKAFWPLARSTISVSLGSLQQVARDCFYSLFFLAQDLSAGCLSPAKNHANYTLSRATGVSSA